MDDRAPPRPHPSPSHGGALRIVVSVVLVAALLAAGFGVFHLLAAMKAAPQRSARTPIRATVRVLEMARSTHRELLTGYGRVRALRTARVPAEVAGTVIWLRPGLEAGAEVAGNDELVRLDDRDSQNALASALARRRQAEAVRDRARTEREGLRDQLAAARAELELAGTELGRLRSLVPHAASPSEVDRQRMAVSARTQILAALEARERTAAADIVRAEADIATTTADLAQVELAVARASIRAPFAGVVEARYARVGEHVTPGTTLIDLVDLSRVEVPVELPASRHPDVRPGARAELRIPGRIEIVWTGVVARVAPSVDPESRTFSAYVEIAADGESPTAAPGAFLTATVEGRATPDCFVVPREAFVGDVVYVAVPDGEGGEGEAVVHERRPAVVRLLPDVALVREGLSVGDLIVVTSVEQIAEGSRVSVVRESDASR